MQAIQTHFCGPTNYRDARVIARCSARRMIVSWRYDLGLEENHREAARLLAKALGWFGEFVTGSLPGVGYAHVWTDRGSPVTKVTP